MTDCLFCRIISGDIPTQLLYSDPEVVAFPDIDPQAPTHFLVVARRHIENYTGTTAEDEPLLGHLARVSADIARQERIADSGFRTVVNNGPNARQSVPHLHMHVLGGREMGWPPG